MARYAALAFALGLLAGPAAAWESLNPDCGGTLGGYSTTSAQDMAALFLQGVPAGTISVTDATLIGADYMSGVVDTCQGPFYDSLVADSTTDNSQVLVFTTGYGELPSTIPAEGSSPTGDEYDNFAANDRFTINTCQAGQAGLGFPSACVNGTTPLEFGNICPAGRSSFDASGLMIEFVAEKSASFSFNYIWGSEEYPEYVGRSYTDQFRFLVQRSSDGAVVQDWTNIAKIGGEDVGINTIHGVGGGSNADSYVDNPFSNAVGLTTHPTQYDGFTTLLPTDDFAFEKGETVKIAVVVTDCGDRLLDSMVMIETGSVVINPEPECAGITFTPDPSVPNGPVLVEASFTDNDLDTVVCTFPSGASISCTQDVLSVEGGVATCSGLVTLSSDDYAAPVTCVGTDMSGQSVECQATPELDPPPTCAGITFTPDPSMPGDTVEVAASFSDNNLQFVVCRLPSDATFSCDAESLVVSDGIATCTSTATLQAIDYSAPISCVGTDMSGQTVECQATPAEANPPPTCGGITFTPDPSSPGNNPITVDAVFLDTDMESVTCTFPSGASFSCTQDQLVAVDGGALCSGSVDLAPVDYSAPVSCVGADMSGQTVECQATPTFLPPSPSVPAPLPSPEAPPSPSVPAPLPPSPSPAVCEKPEPVPPVGCPDSDPNCAPTAANCTTYNMEGTMPINGPLTVSCSKCQWECLTNTNHCGGISLYNDATIIDRVELATYNCGDGGFGGALFSSLCVLETAENVFADTQNQPCFNCKQQCEAWAECTGVYFEYIYYSKENLGNMPCC